MKFLHTFLIFNVLLLLIFCQPVVFGQEKWVVVLDAGHGGKDPGTVNGRSYEKDVNLAVVLATGKILEQQSNIKVIYTRRDDTFVELSQRSAIAVKAKADLFVSVHSNAAANKSASGADTYILGAHKDEANLAVAMRENGVISLEKNYSTTYEGYDPTSAESLIMFSLMQYAYTRESLKLASLVQGNYKKIGRKDRGVKQAGFLVLWKNSMPSILTELGFMSNSEEVKFLMSKSGQQKMADGLAQSIIEYVASSNKVSGENVEVETTVVPPKPTVQQQRPTVENKVDAEVYYAIQFYATKSPIKVTAKDFGRYVMDIEERKTENYYKYTLSRLFIYKEALLLQREVRKICPKAFIVAYDKAGNQVEVREARKILEGR